MQGNWDYGITSQLKFGLRDHYTPFEIGITGLHGSPFRALLYHWFIYRMSWKS